MNDRDSDRAEPEFEPLGSGTTYSVQGNVKAVGRLARGARHASRSQWRFVGWLALATIVAILALALIATVVDHLAG